jgi:integrase
VLIPPSGVIRDFELAPANLPDLTVGGGVACGLRLGLVARNVADMVDPPRKVSRQMQERLAAEDARQDNDLVFCTRSGKHIAGTNLCIAHMRLLKRVGLPYIRFHDLRHAAATLLLLQGVPVKVVSEMLGHASVTITMNLYMHVLPTMQQAAAEAMEALFRSGLQS